MSIILAIESSCDDTAAAVLSLDNGLLSHETYSQAALHSRYGGVVPELASRYHIEVIDIVVQKAVERANKTVNDIDYIAVTNRPGLPGSLLVGVAFAKTVAWCYKKPIIGINHLEGHIFSAFIETQPPFPHLCLTASGGHTALYLVRNFGDYVLLGNTRDDAAGEAFDKIAKLIGLGYPGGPIIEKLAQQVNFQDFFAYPRSHTGTLDFSFSGLKTAVLYHLVKQGLYNIKQKEWITPPTVNLQREVASSFLVCVKDIFLQKLRKAVEQYPEVRAITFVGGVACNQFIKKHIATFAQTHNCSFFSPSPAYCTDNAAMIAIVAQHYITQKQFDSYELDIALYT